MKVGMVQAPEGGVEREKGEADKPCRQFAGN